jgi:tetratricopeptide (TPR) repeat protein
MTCGSAKEDLTKPSIIPNNMKTKFLKTILLTAMSLLLVLPVLSQKGIEDGSKYGKGADSINCIKNLSLYKEFFKHNNYKDAIPSWRLVFGECPASSERMYLEGITMYRKFIESSSVPERTEELIDTILMIYDRRIEYFDGEGNVLGRKGIDMLRYRRADIEAVNEAYGDLKRSVELQKNKSRDAVMVTFISASITLNQKGKIDDNQVIEDYFMATEIIDKLLDKSSRWPRAKATIDNNMIKSGLLTCDALNSYFEPQFEANKEDRTFLENVIRFYDASGCDRADLYVSASEQMYKIDPGPESAHQLARLFMIKSDFIKAADYLKMAVIGEGIDDETRAEWYYELTIVLTANEDYCSAIFYANEAISRKSDYGKAYIALGDAIISSRGNLGNDFEKRAAFWVAADKYAKAKSVDPSVAADANKKLSTYAGQYPNHEEVFFRDLKDGDSYQVKGCINAYTTVRSRK